eukprot:TRINITY_DN10366_c0_g1_i1.p2 TRINITY_DN10366_c0_g1~~TRINITY_DN10366_c0_g1_i1.p2  ORF type:complete len:235 (+),score=74.12 TRINITY_DN10366_c0_g1_i1:116-820(+)
MDDDDLRDGTGECKVNRTVVSRAVRAARDTSTGLEVLVNDGAESKSHQTLSMFSKVLMNVPSTLTAKREQKGAVAPPTLDLKPGAGGSEAKRPRVNLSALCMKLGDGADPGSIPELQGSLRPPRHYTHELLHERRTAQEAILLRRPPPKQRVDYAQLHKQQQTLVQDRMDSETVYKELLDRYHAYTDAILDRVQHSSDAVFPDLPMPAPSRGAQGGGGDGRRRNSRRSVPLHLL